MSDRKLGFLLDTNVVIAVEAQAGSEPEQLAPEVSNFVRQVQEQGHRLQVHPAAVHDFARDPDENRRQVSLLQYGKYPKLPNPPAVPDEWRDRFTWVEHDNDHIDLLHLAAAERRAVSFLVTHDRRLHRRATAVGLDDRVVTVQGAIELLAALHRDARPPPPTVGKGYAHDLDPDDPIFDSLRETYAPEFDDWFDRAREEQRPAFYIRDDDGRLAAIALLKVEQSDTNDAGLPGRVLKISTLKVAQSARGTRRGELLLKSIFEHASAEQVDGTYVTVFEDEQESLVAMLSEFGFVRTDRLGAAGDNVYAKRLDTSVGRGLEPPEDPLAYHRMLGPPAIHPDAGTPFVVPIQPDYVARLFPDAPDQQLSIMDPAPYGNALRKAYLCRAATRKVGRGDFLLFYESKAKSRASVAARGVFAVGVVESVLASEDPSRIIERVGTRTVYSLGEVETMTQQGSLEVLAIVFRQDRFVTPALTLSELTDAEVLTAHPQSITKVDDQGAQWLRTRIHR